MSQSGARTEEHAICKECAIVTIQNFDHSSLCRIVENFNLFRQKRGIVQTVRRRVITLASNPEERFYQNETVSDHRE
jgi:hypothetical protein